jgi:hypothetical protein
MRSRVRGALVRSFILFSVGLACVALPAIPQAAAPKARATIGGSGATPLSAIETSADVVDGSHPLNNLDPHDPLRVLAYDEIALTRSAQLLATSDPTRSQRYLATATSIAAYLVQNDARESDGKIGWGLPYAWNPFGGATLPPNQIYAFQTAVVSRALLETYALNPDPNYLHAVESAMANFAAAGTSTIGQGCADCFFYWYTTNANNVGRYVKNTNVLLGLVDADLYLVTGQAQYQASAQAVYNEEAYEVVQQTNVTYFGVDDPKYSPTRGPDAHIVLETFAYSQLAQLLGLASSQTQATFDALDATFWSCGMTCLAAPIAPNSSSMTTEYSQFMACYPTVFDTTYGAGCVRMLANPYQTFLPPFPLIGLLYAYAYLPTSTATAPTTTPPRGAPPTSQPSPVSQAPPAQAAVTVPPSSSFSSRRC